MPEETAQPGTHRGMAGGAIKKKVTVPAIAIIGLILGALAWIIWRGHQGSSGTAAAGSPGVPSGAISNMQGPEAFGSQLSGIQDQLGNLVSQITAGNQPSVTPPEPNIIRSAMSLPGTESWDLEHIGIPIRTDVTGQQGDPGNISAFVPWGSRDVQITGAPVQGQWSIGPNRGVRWYYPVSWEGFKGFIAQNDFSQINYKGPR